MVIHGYYNDIHDNIISVEIYKASGSGDYDIGEFFDNEHHFAFDGRKPVTIKHDSKDLFDPLVSATCKIKLRSNIWCGDMLFSQGIGDILVKVSRQLNPEKYEGSVSQMIFIGYVKPISFNQNINKHDNVIDINAVDLIGYLKEQYLSTTTSELSDSTSAWKEAIANSKYRNFKEMFERAGLINHEFVFSSNTYTTSLYADPIKQNMLNNFYISDNLWLGESKDNEMSFADILTEILKYTNTRLVAVNGLDYYLFENGQATTLNSLDWYHSNTITTIDDVGVVTTLPKENIANEQVTMDDCYNIIGVKCELETIDDVVSSPLKEDALTSPYVNQQLYLREYFCDLETDDWDLMRDFCNIVLYNGFSSVLSPVQSDKAKFCDWYIRYLENPEWTYHNRMFDDTFLSDRPGITPVYNDATPPQVINQIYTWQSRVAHDLGYVKQNEYHDGAISGKIPARPYNDLGGAYFVGLGKTKDYDKTDNSPNGNVSLTNYLVIPVKGLARGNSAEQTALNDYATILQQYNTNPMISYVNPSVMNLSPADPQTTNYIVISGKLRCMPVYQYKFDEGRKTSLMWDLMGTYEHSCDKILDEWLQDIANHDQPGRFCAGPNGTRMYYPRFMDLYWPNWDFGDMNNETEVTEGPNVKDNECMLMMPPQDCDGLYQFQYKYNMITAHTGTTYDAVTHVPILCCRLYVVNETRSGANRKYVQQDPQTFAFSWTDWVTTSDATFCISINPKIDDYIIGPEYDITNTVTAGMNLSKSGLAIPIKQSDNVSGKVHFEILGPYNTQYDDVHCRTHSKWTQFWRGEYPQDFSSNPRCLLDRISNIFISKFEMIIDSDHAKNSTLNSGDLLYYSEDTYKYNNPKDVEFKICTALTSEQAAMLNVASGVSFNNPTLDNGDLYTTTAAKPEEQYITTMYNRYSTPKKIVEYNCDYDNNKIRDMYCSRYSCTLMNHLNVSPFNSFILSDEMDLKNDRLKIYLREI